jgi:hypothetical protein
MEVPAPTLYQKITRDPLKPSFRPFNQSAERFIENDKELKKPG